MRIKSLTLAVVLATALTTLSATAAPTRNAKTTGVRDRDDDNPIVRIVKQIKRRLATITGEIIIPPPSSNTTP